jgi:hypothetical protein
MDIEAISGPGVTDGSNPATNNGEIVPVERVLSPMINDTIRINWNVMDKVTISPAARRKYEEWRSKSRKRERERETG